MRFAAPTREDLVALEEKYAQIEALRRARERGEPLPDRLVFKTMADRFPGALRELDMVPMDMIQKRRQQLKNAISSGIADPWMAWMIAYHELLRVALWVKLRTAKQREINPERLNVILRGVTDQFGFGVDESFVRDAARPTNGRLNAVVFERLERMFGVPMVEMKKELYVRRG